MHWRPLADSRCGYRAGENGYATYAITKGSGMDTYRDGNGNACRDAFGARPVSTDS